MIHECSEYLWLKPRACTARREEKNMRPSNLPRTLLSRWSRAAWRCHRKSLLWQPWGKQADRHSQANQATDRAGERDTSHLNNTTRCSLETLFPFPAKLTHTERHSRFCKSHFFLNQLCTLAGMRSSKDTPCRILYQWFMDIVAVCPVTPSTTMW